LKLAPNPAIDLVSVQWSADQVELNQLRIINTTGQLMQQQTITGGINNLELRVDDYPSGVYFVQATSVDGIHTKRFMKL